MAFVFFFVALVVLILWNTYTYFLVVWLFRLTSRRVKLWIKIGLLVVCLGFIFANLLNHYGDSVFSKGIYMVFGIGIGFVVNFMVVMTIVLLVYKVVLVFVPKINPNIFGIVGFVLTVLLSGYGVWNAAYNLQVKEITVKIKDLPEQWKGKKVVQISDVHLGPASGADFLRKIVDKINLLNPEMVFITGDFFDGMDGYLDEKAAPLSELRAKKGVYFVTGNHEIYLGVQKAEESLKGTNVQILDNELVDVDGLQIVGVSYSRMFGVDGLKDIILGIKNYDPNSAAILLYHAPQGISDAKAAGIDLQLSGHTHKGQIFPGGLIVNLIFGKYSYGLTTEGDYSIYTSSGVGTWGPMMRTSGSPEIVLITLE